MAHLWEVDHSYYCNDNNYYANNVAECDSWQTFVDEAGDMDMDYNLLFRWDWRDSGNPDEEIEQDELHLHFMAQRKGRFFTYVVKVDKGDEQLIADWLKPRFEHLVKLWLPLEAQPVNA